MSDYWSNTGSYKRKGLIPKGLALLLGSAAIFILWGTWAPFLNKHRFTPLYDLTVLLFLTLPSSLLAFYFFFSAKILWRGMSSQGIHKLAVCLSLLFSALLYIFGLEVTPQDQFFWTTANASFAMIIAGIFFLLVKQWLLKSFSVSEVIDYPAQRSATRIYFGLLAFLICLDISAITELLPKHANHEHVPANLWLTGLIILSSISVAWWCYRTGLRLFLKWPPSVKIKQKEQEQKTFELIDTSQILHGTSEKSV